MQVMFILVALVATLVSSQPIDTGEFDRRPSHLLDQLTYTLFTFQNRCTGAADVSASAPMAPIHLVAVHLVTLGLSEPSQPRVMLTLPPRARLEQATITYLQATGCTL